MKKIILILIILFTFRINILLSQVTDEQIKSKVEEMANKYLSNKENSGLAFGIIKDANSPPLIYTFGYANKSTNEQVNSSTIFQIGSITKSFTGTLLAQFVKDGKMKLDDPVQKYLPENVHMPTYEGKEITLEELGTHTSGLPRMPGNFKEGLKEKDNPYAYYTTEYLYEFLNGYKLKYEPGKHWEYSNLAFGLLGQVLSIDAKKSYGELVVQDISDKLDMPDTRMTLNDEQNKRRVQGYNKGEPVHDWTFTNCTAGGGALYSTINDMMNYLKFNMGITQNEISPLTDITEKVYWDDPSQKPFSMGLAWQIFKIGNNLTRYNKDGEVGGCTSIIAFTKEPKTGVVILSNSGDGPTSLANELIDFLNGIK